MLKAQSDYSAYQSFFSPEAMWRKISSIARRAGTELVYAVLLLYYVATASSTSKADKARIYGVIGYFILPLDLVPDALPFIGYTDDVAAVIWGLKSVWENITPEIKEKARQRLTRWFGQVDAEKLDGLLSEISDR